MGQKYHINKNGVPAVCRAKEGNCPYGGESGSENHFDTIEEAQVAADKQNELQFGLIGGVKFNTATTDEDFRHIENRLNEAKQDEERDGKMYYFTRCKTSERIHDYTPNDKKTDHYINDRVTKEQLMIDEIGEGSPIAYYKVHQFVKGRYKDQMVEVMDTGQIKIYDARRGHLVTTFVPARERMEIMMLKAGDIPNEQWLEQVKRDKKIIDDKWEEMQKEEEKKNGEENKKSTQSNKETNKSSNNKQNNSSNRNKNNKNRSSQNKRKQKKPIQYNKHGIPING